METAHLLETKTAVAWGTQEEFSHSLLHGGNLGFSKILLHYDFYFVHRRDRDPTHGTHVLLRHPVSEHVRYDGGRYRNRCLAHERNTRFELRRHLVALDPDPFHDLRKQCEQRERVSDFVYEDSLVGEAGKNGAPRTRA